MRFPSKVKIKQHTHEAAVAHGIFTGTRQQCSSIYVKRFQSLQFNHCTPSLTNERPDNSKDTLWYNSNYFCSTSLISALFFCPPSDPHFPTLSDQPWTCFCQVEKCFPSRTPSWRNPSLWCSEIYSIRRSVVVKGSIFSLSLFFFNATNWTYTMYEGLASFQAQKLATMCSQHQLLHTLRLSVHCVGIRTVGYRQGQANTLSF